MTTTIAIRNTSEPTTEPDRRKKKGTVTSMLTVAILTTYFKQQLPCVYNYVPDMIPTRSLLSLVGEVGGVTLGDMTT